MLLRYHYVVNIHRPPFIHPKQESGSLRTVIGPGEKVIGRGAEQIPSFYRVQYHAYLSFLFSSEGAKEGRIE